MPDENFIKIGLKVDLFKLGSNWCMLEVVNGIENFKLQTLMLNKDKT